MTFASPVNVHDVAVANAVTVTAAPTAGVAVQRNPVSGFPVAAPFVQEAVMLP